MHFSRFYSVLNDRSLRLLFYNQAAATLASRAFDMIVVWIALQRGSSYDEAGLLIFFRFLPYIAFGLAGGWISDRFNKKNIVVFADLIRGLVLLVLSMLIAFDLHVIFALGAATFLLTSLRTIFQPALQGLLPELAKEGMVGPANSVLHSCNEICGMIAPAATGFLLAYIDPEYVTGLSGALFIAAAAFGAFLRVVHAPKREAVRWSVIRSDYADAWRDLNANHKGVRTAIVANAIAVLGVGGLLSLAIPVLMESNVSFGATTLGLFTASMALGTIPGAYASAFVAKDRQSSFMYLAWISYGLLIATTCLFPDRISLVALGLLLGFFGAVADILFVTTIQEDIPQRNLSKTFAIFSTFANTGEAVSGPMMASIIGASSLGLAFGAGGAIVIAICVAGLYVSLRFGSSHSRQEG